MKKRHSAFLLVFLFFTACATTGQDPQTITDWHDTELPPVPRAVEARIEEYRKDGVDIVVLEAALLFEAGWNPLVDEVWVTVASEPTVVQRVKERTGLPEEQILSRIRSQLSVEERTKQANLVIDNDGGLDELRIKVEELWEGLKE